MKYLFKKTKVVFDAHLKQYDVYYKNWLIWQFDSCYKYDERDSRGYLTSPTHYCDKGEAEKRAITRAHAMIDTVEVWRSK